MAKAKENTKDILQGILSGEVELTLGTLTDLVARKGITAAAEAVEGKADQDRARQVEIKATMRALSKENSEIEKRLQTRAVVLAKAIKRASKGVGVSVELAEAEGPAPAPRKARKTAKK